MYLILRMNTTAKGAKKNTLPNVMHLHYNYTLFFFQKYIGSPFRNPRLSCKVYKKSCVSKNIGPSLMKISPIIFSFYS